MENDVLFEKMKGSYELEVRYLLCRGRASPAKWSCAMLSSQKQSLSYDSLSLYHKALKKRSKVSSLSV